MKHIECKENCDGDFKQAKRLEHRKNNTAK